MSVSLVSKALSHQCSGRGEDVRWVCSYWEPRLGLACTRPRKLLLAVIQKPSLFLKKLPVCSRNTPFWSSFLVVHPSGSPVLIIYCDQTLARSHLPGHFSYMGTWLGPEWMRAFFLIVHRNIHSPRGSGNLISCTSESVKEGKGRVEEKMRTRKEMKDRCSTPFK